MELDLDAIKLWNAQFKVALEADTLDISGDDDWSDKDTMNDLSIEEIATQGQYNREWLISKCQKIFNLEAGPNICIDILNLLRSKEVDIQNQLLDLVGYDSFEFLEQLLTNRMLIVNNIMIEYNRMHPPELKQEVGHAPFGTQVTVVSKKDQELIKKARKLQRKQKNTMGREDLDSSILLGFDVPIESQPANKVEGFEFGQYQPAEIYPNVFISGTKSKVLSSYASKFVLPQGTVRNDDTDKEEIFIPITPVAPSSASERLRLISEFPAWVQPAFQGYKSLNRIQSIVYPIAFESNENMLICAPTGAGKTDVALMTILRTITNYRVNNKIEHHGFKIVYVAPMKALAAEIVRKFSKRLNFLNIQVRELTGDMQLTKAEINSTQVIVTTPEKWDVVTRKSVGDTELVQKVKLLILDEVHLLHEDRGSVIEVLVARTLRLVESSQSMIRIVGLSATLPNYADVALFLGVDLYKGLFFFDGGYRPVPLEQHLIGIKGKFGSIAQRTKEDSACYEIVEELLKNGHQVMIFVHSRKATVNTCKVLLDEAGKVGGESLFDSTQHEKFGLSLKQVQKSRNRELQKYFPLGLGFHNAGMLRTDRNLVEKLFTDGLIKVLCTTATLAWGVNLPAFAVVIKGTKVYNSEKGEFMDLSILDVLQIFGRAGRPQFEDRGVGYILTEHDRLNYYVSALLQQHPIESTFGEKITNNLCAEISLGTISNMTEAVIWLSYTYLYVRMKKNPFNYGLNWQDIAKDPMLVTKRTELILAAAKKLHQAQMIHFNAETGYMTAKDLGRISSNYYIDFNTIEIINRKMHPTMMETEALEMLSMATEFENLRVRQEETFEMKRLLDRECVCSVKAGIETSSGKANILLQAYISRAFVEDFALSSDTNFVAQNSARIIRALFEIALSRNWGPTASTLLQLCKTVDKRLWSFEHPLLQFPFPADIQEKIAKARLNSDMDSLSDMTAVELGALLRFQKMGDKVKACIMQFPILRLQAEMFPITRAVSRVSLRIHCDFTWNDQVHGLFQKFYLWVESYDNIELLHFEDILISKKQQKEEILLAFTIPIPYTNTTTDGIPPQIFFRVISDSWLGSETILPFSLRNVIMPMADNAAHTDLLSLQPLPISALHNQVLEDICHERFEYFNPVQTQVFHTLYNTRHNVLLGAPTGSGKTLAAELAMWSAFRDYPDSKVIYIAPLKALVRERVQDWNSRLMSPMKRRLVALTGDVTPDIRAIESADVIITTPEKWDGVSRSWRRRNYVSSVSCVIIDEIHLLGGDRGPILEVIVSRMNYISSQVNRKIRIVGLSTALANAGDLADWLSCGHIGLFNFRHSVRPVPLEIYIEGYAGKHYCPRMVAMNRPSYLAILNHSPKQPVLVFVSSRRQTRLTARDFIALCGNDDNPRRFLHMEEHEMDALLFRISDASLKMSLPFGIGLHHAGIVDQDRKIVEELFLNNKIQVLIATSTLAWGVNLPAHLVVIKGTEFYDAKIKGYKDFPITDVLQMMGRAGRPQFDNTGVAVVLVHDAKKEFYKKFLHEPFPVESSLHKCVEDHLNAEIVAGTIRSMQDAMDYITWTYLFRRIRMNPTYYGCENNTESAVSGYLSKLIEISVISLEDCGCVEIGANYSVAPTALGQIASHYYLSHKTTKYFKKRLLKEYSDKSAHDFVLLLKVLANAEEFSELPVRHNEDIQNRELELNLEYPMNSDDQEIETFTYDNPHGKSFLLLQAHISRFTDMPVADYLTDTISVLDQSIRVVQAMIDFAILQDYLSLCLGLINVLRSLKQALWPTDSPLLMLPHIKHNDLGLLKIGMKSVTTINQLCSADQRDVYEMLKPLKLGNQKVKQIQETIAMLPSISVSEFLVPNETEKFGRWYLKPSLEYKVKITINRNNTYPTNKQEQYTIYSPRFPKPQKEGWFLIVTNPIKNTIVAAKRLMPILNSKTYISSMVIFKTPEYLGEHDYEIKIISDGYYGIETRHVLRMIIS